MLLEASMLLQNCSLGAISKSISEASILKKYIMVKIAASHNNYHYQYGVQV